jgi:hypothetical protein
VVSEQTTRCFTPKRSMSNTTDQQCREQPAGAPPLSQSSVSRCCLPFGAVDRRLIGSPRQRHDRFHALAGLRNVCSGAVFKDGRHGASMARTIGLRDGSEEGHQQPALCMDEISAVLDILPIDDMRLVALYIGHTIKGRAHKTIADSLNLL